MTISISIVLLILFIHWIGDFLCQTKAMAYNKSTSNKWLTIHVATYTAVWLIIMLLLPFKWSLWFVVATFVSHWLTDKLTSQFTTRFHKEGNMHAFFTTIGFDQLLHYTQLLLCWNYFVM